MPEPERISVAEVVDAMIIRGGPEYDPEGRMEFVDQVVKAVGSRALDHATTDGGVQIDNVLDASSTFNALHLRKRLRNTLYDGIIRANGVREGAELARTDVLTKLPNRMAYNERIALEVRRQEYEPSDTSNYLALFVGDLDHLRRTNNDFGSHSAGDLALASAASDLASAVRPGDFAGRIGGDEFVVVARFQAETRERAQDNLEEMRNHLTEGVSGTTTYDDRDLTYSMTFGGTLFQPGDTPETLFRIADADLYVLKHFRTGEDATDTSEITS